MNGGVIDQVDDDSEIFYESSLVGMYLVCHVLQVLLRSTFGKDIGQ